MTLCHMPGTTCGMGACQWHSLMGRGNPWIYSQVCVGNVWMHETSIANAVFKTFSSYNRLNHEEDPVRLFWKRIVHTRTVFLVRIILHTCCNVVSYNTFIEKSTYTICRISHSGGPVPDQQTYKDITYVKQGCSLHQTTAKDTARTLVW